MEALEFVLRTESLSYSKLREKLIPTKVLIFWLSRHLTFTSWIAKFLSPELDTWIFRDVSAFWIDLNCYKLMGAQDHES